VRGAFHKRIPPFIQQRIFDLPFSADDRDGLFAPQHFQDGFTLALGGKRASWFAIISLASLAILDFSYCYVQFSARTTQGLHNNQAPFGATKDDNGVLVRDLDEYLGLLMAFTEYSTANFGDNDIARKLNAAGYKSKTGRPFSKDTVRDLLQNRTYIGEVKYQEYYRNADGSRSYDAPVQWFKGQHEPLIDS
jgi:hypothetical protein